MKSIKTIGGVVGFFEKAKNQLAKGINEASNEIETRDKTIERASTEKNEISTSKQKGEKLLKEFERPSITAPLAKGSRIAAPFAVAMGAEKMLESIRGKGKPASEVVTNTMQGV